MTPFVPPGRRAISGAVATLLTLSLAGIGVATAADARAKPCFSTPASCAAPPVAAPPVASPPVASAPVASPAVVAPPTKPALSPSGPSAAAPASPAPTSSAARPPYAATVPPPTVAPGSSATSAPPIEATLDTALSLVAVNGTGPLASGVTTGDRLSYQVTVTNNGPHEQSTTVTEPIPPGTSFGGAPGWILGPDGTARADITVAAGTSVTRPIALTVTALPWGTSVITNAITTLAGACASCTVTTATAAGLSTAPQLRTINGVAAAPDDTVGAGDVLVYQLTVTNSGGSAATPTLTEWTPANSRYSGPSTEGWTFAGDAVGGPATTAVTVAAGASSTVTFTVTVADPLPAAATQIVNRVGVSLGSCGPCSLSSPVPGYEVTKTVSATIAHPGDRVSYTITAHNSSTRDRTAADPIRFSDDLASVLDDATYDHDATGDAQPTGTGLSWALALAAGATATVTYSVTVNDRDTGDHLLPNSVRTPAGGNGNCPPTSLRTACAPPAVRVQSFTVAISASATKADPGQTVRYSVTVHNTGVVDYPASDRAQFGVDLSDVLDDAAIVSTASGTRSGNSLNWAVALAAGASVTVTFAVTVREPITGDQVLRASLTAGAGGTCADGCDARAVGVQAYSVSLRASASKAHPGDTVTYSIGVRNIGAVDFTGVDPARFSVDLGGLLDDATYANDATGGASLVGSVLSWRLPVKAGSSTTVTFSVGLSDIVTGDHQLVVSVVTPLSSSGNCAPGSDAAAGPACAPAPVGVQAFTVTKTSSVTTTAPGGVVNYTIAVRNTGSVDYTAADPARFDDNLSGVLDDASYNNDATGSPTRAGNVLSWALALPTGASTTVTYSLIVNTPDTGDHRLLNTVQTRSGTGGNCPPASTDLACAPPPAGSKAYTVTLTANQSSAMAGNTVVYTATVRNTGATAYTAENPARFIDDLKNVLDDASDNRDATGGAVITGSILTWSGALAVNATATVRFSVTIGRPDTGDAKLLNVVVTPAGASANCPPGGSSAACSAAVYVARLALVATATPATMRAAGDVVTYSFSITNTGALTTNTAKVSAAAFTGGGAAPDLSGCASPFTSLAPGASHVCTATYVVRAADLAAGQFSLTAVAHAVGPLGADVVSNASTASVVAQPALSVAMTTVTIDANGDGVIDAGDRIDWQITVANHGRSVANSVRVSAGLTKAEGSCGRTALAEGNQTGCTIATYLIKASDADRTVTNTAVAKAVDLAGFTVTSSPVSAAVHVSQPKADHSGSGTNSRLLLISAVTFVAALGLLVLAGIRRRTR